MKERMAEGNNIEKKCINTPRQRVRRTSFHSLLFFLIVGEEKKIKSHPHWMIFDIFYFRKTIQVL